MLEFIQSEVFSGFTRESIVQSLARMVFLCPILLLLVLGIPTLLGRPPAERTTGWFVKTTTAIGFLASLSILAIMLAIGSDRIAIDFGQWVEIPHYHFSIKFVFDRLSVPFVILTFVLCGTVGAFANVYMHREKGFNRFFVFYALFLLGMVMTSLAATIETLFAGWEFVGLSSALLIAFYHERPAPPRNGLRVWAVYRISDAALLVAAVVLHHLTGEGDFDALWGTDPAWPFGQVSITSGEALTVGLLLLLAAAGKSALIPFCGWLPRAMEGPTPSSAVFYGALSVHLGAFLLLRVSPILDRSPLLCAVVVAVGLLTAIFAASATRVQSDIKCALCFASLTQIGIIVVEIGLGLRYIALIHILSHGCLRTLQFVRAPSLLYDYRAMENAIGDRLPKSAANWDRWIPMKFQVWFYRMALERGYLDASLSNYIVVPFMRVFGWFDAVEHRWTRFLSGSSANQPEEASPSMASLDELL